METLPTEIITSILKYLSVEDRRQMRLLNKSWYYASLHPILLYDEIFVYSNFDLFELFADVYFSGSDESEDIKRYIFKKIYNGVIYLKNIFTGRLKHSDIPEKYIQFERVLLASKRPLFQLKLHDTFIRSGLFEKLGDRIVSLNLTLDNLSDSSLDLITNNCENLQSLQLMEIHKFLIDFKPSRKPLLKMQRLSMESCSLSDKGFNILVQLAPHLMDITICYCNVSLIQSLNDIKQYYSDDGNCEISTRFNSDEVFTNLNIIHFLKSTNRIINLSLSDNLIFCNLPKHIKLKSLSLKSHSFFGDSETDNIKLFIITLSEQSSLENLEVYEIPCCLLSAVSNMYNLKHLKLDYVISTVCKEKSVTDCKCLQIFVNSLRNMKYLKTLQFSSIWSHSQTSGIQDQIPDCTLSSLTSLVWSFKNNLNIIKFGTNLTKLKIDDGSSLSANDLRLLFVNLTNLIELSISQCFNLDDDVLSSSPVSNIKGLISLTINDAKLTWQSLLNIKLSFLKMLFIMSTSLEWKNLSKIEDIFKTFGHSVPALTILVLKNTDTISFFSDAEKNTDFVKKYLPKIKQFKILVADLPV